MFVDQLIGEILKESENFGGHEGILSNNEKLFEEPVITSLEGFDIIVEDEDIVNTTLSEETLKVIEEISNDAAELQAIVKDLI